MKKIQLHADGNCLGKGDSKAGAGAILIYEGRKKEFAFALGIENIMRAEMLAIIKGLSLLTEPCEVTIYSDSQVVINCITGVYQRKANTDLWQDFDRVSKEHKISAEWNRKDSTTWNTRANELALQAARTQSNWTSD